MNQSAWRLMVIEDDWIMAELMSRVAEEAGFESKCISSEQAIEGMYDQFTPHVMLLDILMPGCDGFEILEFLNLKKSQTRIVVTSVQGNYREMAQRLAEGLGLPIVASIAKPFAIDRLRHILEVIRGSLETEKDQPVLVHNYQPSTCA